MRRHTLTILVLGLAACSTDEPMQSSDSRDTASDARIADVGEDRDSSVPDAATDDTDPLADIIADAPSDTVAPGDYCETTVDFFCDYYLRCGRMAVTDLDECRQAFLQTCNEIFEPRYASYVDRGLLALSRAGIEQCREHLADVACEVQLFDLDLGCSQMWQGQAARGEICAPGIGSFVCAEGTVCTLGLDLCGECIQAAPVGGVCAEAVRCVNGAQCVDGTCVQRALPGESCADRPCVTGAGCVDGTCEGPTIVAAGDACDAQRRCPYKSDCIGGVCVESALLGESCADRGCASGFCDGGVCVAFGAPGEACDSGQQCLSGQCQGSCGPVERACF